MCGRNGESPVPVLAATSPSDAFATAFEAVRIALEYMTPVIVLSDGAIANGSEPWLIPDETELPGISVNFLPAATETDEPFMPSWREIGPSRAPRGFNTGSAESRKPTSLATSATTLTITST